MAELEFKRTRTKVRFGWTNLTNYAYYAMQNTLYPNKQQGSIIPGDYKHDVCVKQMDGSVQVFMLQLCQNFVVGPLHWDNEITWQKTTDEDALPLPQLNCYSNLYLLFRIAKVLRVQLGGDVRFFTKYYAPDYSTAIGQFAVQDYDTPVDMEHYRQLGLSEGDKYFNSGFMVIDLDFWRQHNTERKLLEFAKLERKVYFHDQDALNCVFRGNWRRLSPEWNYFNVAQIRVPHLFESKEEARRFFRSPKVVHFPGRYFKPWLDTSCIPYRGQWLHYLLISEWKDMPLRRNERQWYTVIKTFYVGLKRLYYKLIYTL